MEAEIIDIHNHIIYGLDDGAENLDESINMVKAAYVVGVHTIIATPHFRKELLESNIIHERRQILANETKQYGVSILTGFEVRIDPMLPEMINGKREMMLNQTGYMLIEFPFDFMPIYALETLYKLQLMKITPVIAHPERYRFFYNNFDLFVQYYKAGCLMQLDAASLLGIYGRKVEKLARKMINLNYIHFVASDAHTTEGYCDWLQKAYIKIKKWKGKEFTNRVFYKNAKYILNIQ